MLWVSVCWRRGELGAARPCDSVLWVLLCWRKGDEGAALLRFAGDEAKKRGLDASCEVLFWRGVASAALEGPGAGLLGWA